MLILCTTYYNIYHNRYHKWVMTSIIADSIKTAKIEIYRVEKSIFEKLNKVLYFNNKPKNYVNYIN